MFFEYRTTVAQSTPPLESAKGMIDLDAACPDKVDEPTSIRLRRFFREFNIILEIGNQIG